MNAETVIGVMALAIYATFWVVIKMCQFLYRSRKPPVPITHYGPEWPENPNRGDTWVPGNGKRFLRVEGPYPDSRDYWLELNR